MKWFLTIGCLVGLGAVALAFPQDIFDVLPDDFKDVDSSEHGRGGGEKTTNCTCGDTNKDTRIVGGKETLKNEFPLIAAVLNLNTKKVFCGSTILTPWHAITAAHCTVPMANTPLAILAGEHNISDASDTATQMVRVERIINHEKYDPDTFFYDIAILVLKKQLNFNKYVHPACLPTGPLNLVNEAVRVLGWGRLKDKGVTSEVLMKVDLQILNIKTCANKYMREIRTEDPFQLCSWRKSKDSCQGDSGGPVIWHDPQTKKYTLVGLVSYGKKCGFTSPSLNTDVSYFIPWIQEKIASTGHNVNTCAKVD